MGLIEHKLRVFFRSYFPPIDATFAEKWKHRLTFLYAFSAITLLVMSVKQFVNKDPSKPATLDGQIIDPHAYARKMRMHDAKIVYFDGFKRVREESVQPESHSQK